MSPFSTTAVAHARSAKIGRLAPTPLEPPPAHPGRSLGVGVIGVGLMGSHHAANLSRLVPGARLVGLADPQPDLAQGLAARLGCGFWSRDYQELLANPAVEAVVIASPAAYHPELIAAAAQAGKAIFCEKPLANSLAEADRAIAAVRAAGVRFQIGFQRRFDPGFRAARALVERGELGQVQLLRSITRDPSLDQPERVPPWAIFLETLIHDFDVLRFLAGGAEPVEVYALADALILPDWKSRGMLDTAVVTVRYDSGAMATADASFQAVYGYDVRAEVFGSRGMASVGEAVGPTVVHHTRAGSTRPRPHWFVEVFAEAYLAELASFVESVRRGDRAEGTPGEHLPPGTRCEGTTPRPRAEGTTPEGPFGHLSPEARAEDASSEPTAEERPPEQRSADTTPGPRAENTLADARAALVLALAAIRSVETARPVPVREISR